jgi:hypothetical protein
VTSPVAFAAQLRAALDPLGIDVDDDELPLIQLIHDAMGSGFALLLAADVARFPHEPIDPARAPASR